MRVLHVVTAPHWRGAEIGAADVIGALADLGVEQRVAALRGGDLPFPVPTTIMGERHRRLPGLRIDPRTVGGLRRLIRTWRPHVVQAFGGEPFKHVVAAVGRRPLVYRRIGWASPPGRRGARRLLHRSLLRRADRLVCIAEAVRRETIDVFGIPPTRVLTIPNAVEERRIRPSLSRAEVRVSLGVPRGAPVIPSLGALVWEKDPVAHVAVGRRVHADLPEAVHLIVGEGPLRPRVEGAIGEGEGIRLLGARRDVPELLAAADVLLLASRSEGMPTVLIEAGLAGRASVAYDVAGAGEVLADGITGIVVPPGDVEGVAAAAVKLLRVQRLRDEMGSAARDRCRERFTAAAVAPRYLDVYRELAGG